MQRILIIQTAFLGDVILATPVVTELKRLFPSCEVDFLVRKGNESILANHPAIHEVFTFNKKQGRWKEMWRLIRLFRSKKYDEVINLQRFASSGIITVLAGSKQTCGFDKNPFSFAFSRKITHQIGNGKHEVERNLECISKYGAASLVRPSVFPSDADVAKVDEYAKKNYAVLAPASVWFTKQLPEHKWVELIAYLRNSIELYLIGGPGDIELCQRICNEAGLTEANNLAGKLSLLESCALMRNATRCYVNDSGPLHMASAVNAPVTVFFCSTVPAFGFGPLSEDQEIREVEEALHCRPCGLHGFKACPEKHFKCSNIRVD
jgi:heptosyltransferase-2